MVKHSFIIEGFDIPKEYANDAAKARVYAWRIGKIKRELDVDGSVTRKEFDFKA